MNNKPVVSTSTRRQGRRRLPVVLCVGVLVLLTFALIIASAVSAAASFPDVPASHQYYTAISDLADRDIISGYTDGRFGPGDSVTRQQFAKMVILTGGYPVSEANVCPFGDVTISGPSSLYPDNYVAVAAARGITLGKTEATFDPYNFISRYQVITMVVRAADNLQPGLLVNPPGGWTATGTWGNDPTHGANAARAQYNGLLDGLNLTALNPLGNMTRGEVAQALHNLLVMLATPPTTESSTTTTTTAPPAATYSLAVSTAPAAGGSIARNPSLAAYPAGSVVMLTATPATGYVFTGWSGDASGTANPLTITMNSNKAVVANFVPGPPVVLALTTLVSPAGGGTVQRSPNQAAYAIGASVILTAVPATGYAFHHWEGGATGTANPVTVTMNTAKSVTAFFTEAPIKYYEDLGATSTSGLGVASGWTDYLWLFVRNSDGTLGHRLYGGSWSAWENLGGSLASGASPAAVCSKGFARTDVFARGTNGRLWYTYKAGGSWSTWTDLGNTIYSDPAVCSPEFGDMAVFWRRSDGTLGLKRYVADSWTAVQGLGGNIKAGTRPAAVSYPAGLQNGDIHVFIQGTNNNLWHRWYRGSTSTWTEWYDMGIAINSSPVATSWAVARVDVFYRGTDNQLHQVTGNGKDAHWLPPVRVNTTLIGSDLAAVSPQSEGRIDVFARSTANHLLHTWYSSGAWRY